VGEYAMGSEAGRWLMWAADGRVAETMEIHGGPSAPSAYTGPMPTLQAPDVPQVAPVTAVEVSPQPTHAPVRRVAYEQLSFPAGQLSFPTELLTETDPSEVVEIEQAATEPTPEAKPVLKMVAERPEAAPGK
jgi:hypothetical protein